MAWQDYRDMTDREIKALQAHDDGRFVGRFAGLNEVCELARKKNKKNPLHSQSIDVCAAHLAQLVRERTLQDPEGYEVTNTDLKLSSPEYKLLVRKAFSRPQGIRYLGRRLFFR